MRPTWRNCLILTGVLIASIVCGIGCDDDHTVHSYQTSKDNTPAANRLGPAQAMGPAGAGQPADQQGPPPAPPADLVKLLPPGWKVLPPPTDPQARSMEVARIGVDPSVPNAMLTIVPLSGEGGELLPNVARWQGQLKLPIAASNQDLQKVVTLLDTPYGKIPIVDLTSPQGAASPQRILAAAVQVEDSTFFFTMRGPRDAISHQQSNFQQFIRSLPFASGSSDTTANNNPPPSNQSPGGRSATNIPTYTAPPDWRPAAGNSDMRMLGFSAGPALITVDRLPAGGMNTLIPLINMWRGQVGLGALPDNAIVKPDEALMIDGHFSNLFDMSGGVPSKGGQGGKRLIVAMVAVNDEDWFIKLIGPADAVAKQQSAFMTFMRSIHFGGGSPAGPTPSPAGGNGGG